MNGASRKQQTIAEAAARAVGGYFALVALLARRAPTSGEVKLAVTVDDDGRNQIVRVA